MQVLLIIVFAIIGIVLLFSPVIKKFTSSRSNKNTMKTFNKLSDDFSEDSPNEKALENIFIAMDAYNEHIYLTGQDKLTGKLPKNQVLFDVSELADIDVFAYVDIVKKKVKERRGGTKIQKENSYSFPVYLSANKQNLDSGFATLPQTSLPIGGENTLSVLYGYAKESLYKGKKCIISVGDKIVLRNPYEDIEYRVSDMGSITEEDTDLLKIAEGETEIALLMFLPHMKQRYCIYAKKVNSDDSDEYIDDYDDEDED